MSAADPIPFLDLRAAHAEIAGDLRRAVDEVVASSAFIGGQPVTRFEQAFASYCEAAHAVGVGNGTDALELILEGLRIGPGDEVVVPANTFVATAEAVVRVGAVPVFADVDAESLLVTAETVEAVCTHRTRAVIAVHLYGHVVDVPSLRALCDPRGVLVIEDAAQAHGARFRGRRVGSLGHAAAFSFYPGKNLGAMGDGGAVVTSDDELAEQIRVLANHGRGGGHHRHGVVGRNSRLDGLQAAVLTVKLGALDEWNERRRRLMARYHERLGDGPVQPFAIDPRVTAVHHLAVVRTGRRDDLVDALDAARIGWGLHYPVTVPRQPAYERFSRGAYPIAERAVDEVLSLPLSPTLDLVQVDRVCDVVEATIKETFDAYQAG